jgi:hypothetical protein
VSSKKLTLGGITHKLYDCYYDSKYLGVFCYATDAAAGYAEHVLATYGLVPDPNDPFARPDPAKQRPPVPAEDAAADAGGAGAGASAPGAPGAPGAAAGAGRPGLAPSRALVALSRLAALPAEVLPVKVAQLYAQAASPAKGKGRKGPVPEPPAAKRAKKQSWTQRSLDKLHQGDPPPADGELALPPPPGAQTAAQTPVSPAQQPSTAVPSAARNHPAVASARAPAAPTGSTAPPAPAPSPRGGGTVAGSSSSSSAPAAPQSPGGAAVAEVHPTIEGKLRVLTASVVGVPPGEKFPVKLPGCSHMVRIPFPTEPCTYISFKFGGGCPQCRKANGG